MQLLCLLFLLLLLLLLHACLASFIALYERVGQSTVLLHKHAVPSHVMQQTQHTTEVLGYTGMIAFVGINLYSCHLNLTVSSVSSHIVFIRALCSCKLSVQMISPVLSYTSQEFTSAGL